MGLGKLLSRKIQNSLQEASSEQGFLGVGETGRVGQPSPGWSGSCTGAVLGPVATEVSLGG